MLHYEEYIGIMRYIVNHNPHSGETMPYFDSLKTIRERSGIRVSALAKEAKVDRSTVTRVEKHHNSTPETLHSIVNALNTIGSNGTIKYEEVITETSKFGGK
ncbi:MAG: helix-turn-helix transcriptional regulator [Gammaproteobacteria bacterium]|nr:helix-turn-helix transcriptional regulator [Gammaproteobacteria bacterium]